MQTHLVPKIKHQKKLYFLQLFNYGKFGFIVLVPDNTHFLHRGKNLCTADLRCEWFGFSSFFKIKKWAIPSLFLFIFVFSIHLRVNKLTNVQYKFCRWLDFNRRPLVSEATTLPTEPQPLPWIQQLCYIKVIWLNPNGYIDVISSSAVAWMI